MNLVLGVELTNSETHERISDSEGHRDNQKETD